MKEPGLAAGLNATFTRPIGLVKAGAWDSALRVPQGMIEDHPLTAPAITPLTMCFWQMR